MSDARSWLPICAKCGKVVDCLDADDMPDAVRRYRVYCHGEVEDYVVGAWAAYEIASKHGRLPDAFAAKQITA